jgi:hypothetical protein
MSPTERSVRAGRYVGPPGDDTVYLLPRDLAAWEKAWGVTAKPLADPAREQGEAGEPDPVAKARRAEAMAFIKTYTGTFGLILDIRANPKYGTKYLRLSDRQVDAVLASRDRDLERAERARIPPGLTRPPTTVTEGIYVVDGEPWKAQKNREKTRLYAKRLVPGIDGEKGSWEYVPGGLTIIAQRGSPMTIAEAEAYGALYGVCVVCGRTLTNETSIERAIGPVCYARLAS